MRCAFDDSSRKDGWTTAAEIDEVVYIALFSFAAEYVARANHLRAS